MKMTIEQTEKLKKAQQLISDVYYDAGKCGATETEKALSVADSCISEALDFFDQDY
jgi:hypothetical protein